MTYRLLEAHQGHGCNIAHGGAYEHHATELSRCDWTSLQA